MYLFFINNSYLINKGREVNNVFLSKYTQINEEGIQVGFYFLFFFVYLHSKDYPTLRKNKYDSSTSIFLNIKYYSIQEVHFYNC